MSCGLTPAPLSYTGGSVGGGGATPTYTVATFADLPSAATAGQRCTVTGESGLSGVVVVNVSSGVWSLETVTCAETAIPALGATADTWYSSGGITVTAADGAWLYDSTYGRALRWWPAASLACDGAWIPSEVYARGSRVLDGWLEGTESNTGLAATLLAQGVTAATSAGGGASSIDTTTTAGYLSMISTNPGAGASAITVLTADPGAGFSSTSWGYFRAIMRLSTFTGNAASGTLSVIYDGTDRYDFAVVRSGGSITVDGAFVDASGSPMTRLAAQAAGDNDARTADVLLEMLKRGTRCMVRFNGGTWTTLDGATAIASASKLFQVRATAENNGATACTLRLKRAIWMHA